MEIVYDPDSRTLGFDWENELGNFKIQLTKRTHLALDWDRRPICVMVHLSKDAAANLLAHRPPGLIVIGEEEQAALGSRG
jgi:hypothetical protein